MRTAELTGVELDYWVAKADNRHVDIMPMLPPRDAYSWNSDKCDYEAYSPSTDWAIGGPIIERERISVTFPEVEPGPGFEWHANIAQPNESFNQYGPTPLIAAMRAYVASKHGDEVPEIG